MPGDTAVEAPVGDNDKKIDEPVLLMSYRVSLKKGTFSTFILFLF